MADPAQKKGDAPSDSPPPYTPPMMSGPAAYVPYVPQAPPSVLHPNVVISPNVKFNNPSSVKINGMSLTTMYPPQVVGMVGPGCQQLTTIGCVDGFQTMQSMQAYQTEQRGTQSSQSSGLGGQMQQSMVIPGTGVVISQNFGGPPGPAGPTGPYQY